MRVGTPMARAAWTNSRSRRLLTSPRTSRARPIQPKMKSMTMSTQKRIVEVSLGREVAAGPNRAFGDRDHGEDEAAGTAG